MLYFVTSNENKFREAREILDVKIRQLKLEIDELQLWDIRKISEDKVRNAYKACGKPLFVEDTGLYIKALKGFPGPFISWVRKTIGNPGLLKLMNGVKNRRAETRAVVSFYDGKRLKTFVGSVHGNIAESERGGGWGFDPIFVPKGYNKTYGELGERKNEISHRRKALEKFKVWLEGSFNV